VTAEVEIETYASLADRLLALPARTTRLVAVDGPGGAGKSFFATRLAAALGAAPVVATDDFATGAPGDSWFPRLRAEVLDPLVQGLPGRYRRYDWERKELAEWREVPRAPAVIIEGVSSARRELAKELALAVYVLAPRGVRLERGLRRDGEAARPLWERWMAEEDAHFAADATISRCDLIVDGAPRVRHDPEIEFIRLAFVDRGGH
jgi:cytidylate kinase